MKKIIFTTGGTGGHIYPALAVARRMKKKNIDILFVGTDYRMEKELVKKESFRFIGLDILPLKSFKSIIKMLYAIKKAINIIKKEKPTEVIGFGNYISIPILVAAYFMRVPYYLQEQNSKMGLANKIFYKRAKKIFLAFENTMDEIGKKYKNKVIISGNPIREEFYKKNKFEDRKKMGIKEEEKVILVMGGSLGAKSINNALSKKWKNILEIQNLKIFWATGKDNYDEIIKIIKNKGNFVVEPYFHNIADIMSISDLIICRSGASTISELIELEKPSILIPYDFVGQRENAEILEYINGAKSYSNEEVEEGIEEALHLVKQEEVLFFMQKNIKKLKRGNAIDIILKEMELL